MAPFCSTTDLTGQTYVQKWQGDYTNISGCQEFCDLNAGAETQYVPVVDAFVRKYLITDNHPITYAQQGSGVYDPAIETVINVCQKYPGGCDAVLGQVCSGYTRADLASNPSLADLCGCFLADAQYNAYTGAFGVQKICDPACTLQSAVKPIILASNPPAIQECGQAICVIDNVKIELLQNSTAGNISFNQACASCTGGAGCTCDISNISVTSVESTLGNISLSQQCGGNVNCFKPDANGVPQSVPCSTLEPSGGTGSSTSKLSTSMLFIIIAIIVVVVIIIIVIIFLLSKRKEEPTTLRSGGISAGPPPAYGYGSSGGFNSPMAQAPLF
jgi:hypothetical protein